MVKKHIIKEGDVVDFHSIIGGPITSRGHEVLNVFRDASDNKVAFITEHSGYVSVKALTPAEKVE